MPERLLEIKNLKTTFQTERGLVTAVNGVDLEVFRGRTLGIVGESGSGKSVTALSLMRLIPSPPGNIAEGEINFLGQNLLDINEQEMRKVRGNKISMIFQEPMTSLNPVFTVGNQIVEVLMLHKGMNKAEAYERTVELFRLVGIPAPEKRVHEYPHQLSGGMRQRVMIAMALACEPDILIADEPTTALDVTIQAQILELMVRLQEELGMGIIMITHDLGVVAETCHDVAVMYCGEIVEKADVKTLFENPRHPYTLGLMESIPSLKQGAHTKTQRLKTIEGMVPSLMDLPPGCSFQNRCPYASDTCRDEGQHPHLRDLAQKHLVSCHHPLSAEQRVQRAGDM